MKAADDRGERLFVQYKNDIAIDEVHAVVGLPHPKETQRGIAVPRRTDRVKVRWPRVLRLVVEGPVGVTLREQPIIGAAQSRVGNLRRTRVKNLHCR